VNALFPASAPAPVTGAFAFRCAQCGADNTASTSDLRRVRRPRIAAA